MKYEKSSSIILFWLILMDLCISELLLILEKNEKYV